MSLVITKQTGNFFSLVLDGGDAIISEQNRLTTFGNYCNFKTANGANLILKQNILYSEITIIDGSSHVPTSINDLWISLLDIGFFDGLGNSSGSATPTRLTDLLDTFTSYMGRDGQVLIVNESEQKIETVAISLFTTADEIKLDGIEVGAQVNENADWNESNPASDSYIYNKPVFDFSDNELISNKQDSLDVDGTGTKYPTVDAVNTQFNLIQNQISSIGVSDPSTYVVTDAGYSQSGQNITLNAYWEWVIDANSYTFSSPVVINVPLATAGNSRIDLIVLNDLGTAVRVAGTESVGTPVAPTVPENTIQILFLLTDSTSSTTYNYATKADINSPSFTGTPTAPTPTAGSVGTQIATKDYVLANAGVTSTGTTNRIPKFTSSNSLGDSGIIQVGGNIGMGSAVVPGELFHIGDGNILLEGGGEVAQKFKRDFTTTGENLGVPTGSGVSVNPIFQVGRIIQAGDGDPEIRIMYSDDNTSERTVFEVDRKGIAASVKTSIGSHFEGFASLTDVNPKFRLNSYPRMRLEMGAGGNNITDVAVERGATGSLDFFTDSTYRGGFDANGNLNLLNTPTAPTATAGTNTTQIATTAFVLANAGALPPHLEYNNTDKTIWNNGAGDVSGNTSFGDSALRSNTTGYENTAVGEGALYSNTTGQANVGNGFFALYSNIDGVANTADGAYSLYSNTNGSDNTANGIYALSNKTTGNANTAIGAYAGYVTSTGSNLTDADNSVFLGYDTRPLADNETNQIVIGFSAQGKGSNTATLGNDGIQKTFLKGVINTPKTYTVATLPAGVLGDKTIVTDALAPTYLTTIVGGGTVVCPVFYNGTNWVAN